MEAPPRPFLTVHLFGSERSGKTTLKKQWFESSHSRVLSEIADVHVRIQVSSSCMHCVICYVMSAQGLTHTLSCSATPTLAYPPTPPHTHTHTTHTQQECSNSVLASIRNSKPDVYRHTSFVVMYRPDTQVPLVT